jgi:hypothetical protein
MTINNVAICYYGMTRSLKSTYKSHENFLFNILKANYIRYEIFMHTWNTGIYNIIGDKVSDVPIDYEQYKVLNPNYYQINNQNEFINTINLEDYFNNDLYTANGNTSKGDWNPKLILNHLCSLESIKRVTKLVEDSDVSRFDTVIYIRPDIQLLNEFSMNWFIYFNPTQLMLLNYDHNEGYNDKFAVLHLENYKAYGYRIDTIKEFHKTKGRITPEKFVKYTVLRNYKQIKFIDLQVKIIRPFMGRNFTDENINSIDFNNLINLYEVEEAFIQLIINVFNVPENNSISICIETDTYMIYKDGIWNETNWNEIFNYLYNRYIFYLKNNFETIKESLNKDKIINYNLFFFLGLKNDNMDKINKQLLDFFNNYK